MKFFKLYIILLAAFLAFSACKKYLSEEPKKQTSIQTAEQLEALINNAMLYAPDGTSNGIGGQNGSAGYSTDDTEIPLDAWRLNPNGKWTIDNIYYYTFKTDEIVGLSGDPIYAGEYKKIFTANLILFNIDKVTGDESLKNELKADAHFIRAYAYWVLANHFCLPYTAAKNGNELGMTLKTTIDYDESLTRSTIKETYDFILADLAEAMKTSRNDVDPVKPWRVSKKAIEAFLSRYYLFIGNYDESLVHTDNALTSTTAALVDYHTIVAGTQQNYTSPTASIINSEFYDYTAAKFLYWKEFYMPRFSYQSSQWLLPSTALRSLYDQANDLRFKWLMLANGNRRFTIVTPMLYRYSFFSDGRYIPTGPTVGEMLLNRAEVLARKGLVQEAMNAINILRAKRMNTAAPLAATDKDDAIKKVLEERRRELPFSFRWYDIRRFSVNDYPGDDVTVSRTFYKVNVGAVDTTATEVYSLAPGSRRYAVPINGVEIASAKGAIEQNKY
ncbi:MAG: RagB/SusD family nutrient uptake outer membrane protein [Chitinophagaceae bacterium]|nr:RagB/SusD family nutrient uptake outer membrane protein [Chitinophagaceae bacterium]